MSRLEPKRTKGQPAAAIEVKANAAVEVKKSESKPGKLKEMKWTDAGAQENQQRVERATKTNKEVDAAAKAKYKDFYDKQTAANGCTFVNRWEGWRVPKVVNACNDHDVDYGRGGGLGDKWNADLKLYHKIKATGAPGRAKVTFVGVVLFGPFFFNYRKGGPLPIPEGD